MHSWSDIAAPTLSSDPQIAWRVVSLDGYAELLEVNAAEMYVRVQAGMRLHRLHDILESHGLAMANNGSVAEQSVAGAMATGTHGTGLGHQILASSVLELTIVSGLGEVIRASRTENADVFQAALVSLGALGIIVDYKLAVVKAFDLSELSTPVRLDEFLDNIDTYLSKNEFVKLWAVPHTDPVVARLWAQNRTTGARRYPLDVYLDRFIVSRLWQPVTQALRLAMPRNRWVARRILGTLAIRRKKEYIDRSDRIFTVGFVPRHSEYEFSVPLTRARHYLNAVFDMLDKRHATTMPVEIRFVAADDIWLSSAYGRDSCYITVMGPFFSNADRDALWADLDQLFGNDECRPHWSKEHYVGAAQLRRKYPRFDDFVRVRDRLDPHRLFANDYVCRVLGT